MPRFNEALRRDRSTPPPLPKEVEKKAPLHIVADDDIPLVENIHAVEEGSLANDNRDPFEIMGQTLDMLNQGAESALPAEGQILKEQKKKFGVVQRAAQQKISIARKKAAAVPLDVARRQWAEKEKVLADRAKVAARKKEVTSILEKREKEHALQTDPFGVMDRALDAATEAAPDVLQAASINTQFKSAGFDTINQIAKRGEMAARVILKKAEQKKSAEKKDSFSPPSSAQSAKDRATHAEFMRQFRAAHERAEAARQVHEATVAKASLDDVFSNEPNEENLSSAVMAAARQHSSVRSREGAGYTSPDEIFDKIDAERGRHQQRQRQAEADKALVENIGLSDQPLYASQAERERADADMVQSIGLAETPLQPLETNAERQRREANEAGQKPIAGEITGPMLEFDSASSVLQVGPKKIDLHVEGFLPPRVNRGRKGELVIDYGEGRRLVMKKTNSGNFSVTSINIHKGRLPTWYEKNITAAEAVASVGRFLDKLDAEAADAEGVQELQQIVRSKNSVQDEAKNSTGFLSTFRKSGIVKAAALVTGLAIGSLSAGLGKLFGRDTGKASAEMEQKIKAKERAERANDIRMMDEQYKQQAEFRMADVEQFKRLAAEERKADAFGGISSLERTVGADTVSPEKMLSLMVGKIPANFSLSENINMDAKWGKGEPAPHQNQALLNLVSKRLGAEFKGDPDAAANFSLSENINMDAKWGKGEPAPHQNQALLNLVSKRLGAEFKGDPDAVAKAVIIAADVGEIVKQMQVIAKDTKAPKKGDRVVKVNGLSFKYNYLAEHVAIGDHEISFDAEFTGTVLPQLKTHVDTLDLKKSPAGTYALQYGKQAAKKGYGLQDFGKLGK